MLCCLVRAQVTLAVRTGLLLVLIGFARSILGVSGLLGALQHCRQQHAK